MFNSCNFHGFYGKRVQEKVLEKSLGEIKMSVELNQNIQAIYTKAEKLKEYL